MDTQLTEKLTAILRIYDGVTVKGVNDGAGYTDDYLARTRAIGCADADAVQFLNDNAKSDFEIGLHDGVTGVVTLELPPETAPTPAASLLGKILNK